MKQQASELAWRIKLIGGLAVLGGVIGAGGWGWWLAEVAGGSAGWLLPQWFKWFFVLHERGFGGEIAIAAGVGAATLTAPVFLLFFKARRAQPF